MDTNQNNKRDNDWDDRVLCRDESCTGTVGPDGRCRVCGLPLGDEPVVLGSSMEDHVSVSSEPAVAAPVAEGEGADSDVKDDETLFTEDVEEDTDSDWEDRIPCRDEGCIGTIGPDGNCRVCGLAYENTDP
ncbi:MAG: hypothetical protein U9Q05_00550 [Thermodesulfobacteriota bacterium]|nr:hypothetical protein [Thermodesulfobacteriota bacterium]